MPKHIDDLLFPLDRIFVCDLRSAFGQVADGASSRSAGEGRLIVFIVTKHAKVRPVDHMAIALDISRFAHLFSNGAPKRGDTSFETAKIVFCKS